MAIPSIPKNQLIPNDQIPRSDLFGGLRIVRYQADPAACDAFNQNRYEFQWEQEERHVIPGATLAVKGAPSNYRITAMIHPTLKQFIDIVKYDPSAPPIEDYEALEMKDAHDQTQQDFKGAKKENLANFKQYNVEAVRGDRIAYLPPISGWQSSVVFDETIFVAFDEPSDLVLYGQLYLPKSPVMQSDGQTQTAALFQAAQTGIAIKSGALKRFGVTMEIELNVTSEKAAQSFADRNGRGSKKNKNLVAVMDSSSALAKLRGQSIQGTIFDKRLADGRTVGATETATKNIVDLSTMDQMLLNVVSRGSKKPEQIKHYHVQHLLPFCRDFIEMLEGQFGSAWLDPTPKDSEPYRRIYVHGWAFALKALALAYHDVRRSEIHPYATSIGTTGMDEHTTAEEAEAAFLKAVADAPSATSVLSVAEFEDRLGQIDWLRYRKHWIALTGYKLDRSGSKKRREIKDGASKKVIVEGKAENTAAAINSVVRKILSDTWTDLTHHEDEK
ncbi:hypothetical protein [Kineococcus radiotolerans]|uniref:Uncharacterized protein n=1 Tax=Kineococcus radiotolerans (strain ATCC BAA-149 / DSM 14245 / SRS30216) TaxID=266940 RepID=A6W692_KINRD|nr:hypothetical protein [Kineococcus radiotolerans]ABS02331.1 hypothetical protein Krad_0843 [Kineococcus radiotolerans SRS30216 = ATCC BAA-149]